MKKYFNVFVLLATILFGVLGTASLASATFRVVQTPTLYLYSGESASATSMRITPYPKDLDGTKLTITDFGSSATVTVDPKISGYEEIESFTTITDNGDNTATLSGLSRDLTSKYPYTTAGTGKTHGAGAVVVFGNNPQIYGRLMNLEDTQTVAGNITFSGQTTFTNFPITPTNATSSYAVAGISQQATPAQQAAGTATSTNGTLAPLALAAKNATSTYNSATAANQVVVTGVSGKIDNNFIATSTLFAGSTGAGGVNGNKVLLSTTQTTAVSTADTQIFSVSIPANTLGTANDIKARVYVSSSTPQRVGSCATYFQTAYGTASSSYITSSQGVTATGAGFIDILLAANGATNSQRILSSVLLTPVFPLASSSVQLYAATTTGIDSTTAKNFTLVASSTVAGACGIISDAVTVELFN